MTEVKKNTAMEAKDISYNPKAMESKWQEKWEADKLYRSVIDETRPKHYALTMLPYPCGDLHIGHWYAMTPPDARARYMRMRGYNVLFPMGFDAFGLPAENAAIKDGIHPMKRTFENIERMRKQMQHHGRDVRLGARGRLRRPGILQVDASGSSSSSTSMGWPIARCRRWTGARTATPPWRASRSWGEDRHCERCGTPVIKKDLEQWFFRTTKYAEELLNFDGIDWPERVKITADQLDRPQRRRRGRSSRRRRATTMLRSSPPARTRCGARPSWSGPRTPAGRRDHHAGAIKRLWKPTNSRLRAKAISSASAADKEKTGVFTGAYAINPVNGERIPIWIADYVLMTYGTGAIMAVPAHDERDFAFARKYGLPIIPVIQPAGGRI